MLQSSKREANSGGKLETLKNVETTIRSRVECEERAFRIVNKLIEHHVDGAYLAECGKLISAEHYSDIVEERAISHLCGYPVCPNSLGQTPKHKYHISTKTNKVYEISERKKFCSNQCLKASRHFSEQIPESPLWMRDKEKLSNIVLLSHEEITGIIGDEVIGSNPREFLKEDLHSLEELDKKTTTSKNRSSASGINTTVKQRDKKEKECREPLEKVEEKEPDGPTLEDSREKIVSAESSCVSTKEEKTPCGIATSEHVLPLLVQEFGHLRTEETVQAQNFLDTSKSDLTVAQITDFSISPKQPSVDFKNSERAQAQEGNLSKMYQLKALLSKRKNVLSKMVDVQTFQEVLPSDSISKKFLPANVPKSSKTSAKDENKSTNDAKVSNLTCCPEDMLVSGPVSVGLAQTKTQQASEPMLTETKSPLVRVCDILKTWMTRETALYLSASPYSERTQHFSNPRVQQGYGALCYRLAAQEKDMEAMLNSSLGSEEVVEKSSRPTKPVPDYAALKEQTEAFKLNVMEFITGKKQESQKEQEEDTEGDNAICLPTVDTFNQHQIRVKIVLDRLDKSLPDVLATLQLSVQDVSSPIRELIYTCSLEKDNIVLKPGEWTLAALFILKILASRYPQLESAFSNDLATRHFGAILSKLGHSLTDLHSLSQDVTQVADKLR